jgi:UPF0716 protein FxsA
VKVTAILFVLLVALPIAEITVLIQVGSALGILPTIALMIAISAFGAIMLRQQSFAAFMRANEAMHAGQLPKGAIADGVGLFVAAALILTPGLITSAIGALLLVPAIRRVAVGWAMRRMVVQTVDLGRGGGPFGTPFGSGGRPGPEPRRGPPVRGGGDVIDGEFERVDDEPDAGPQSRPPAGADSPWRRKP